jgi:hypothetical protein
MSKAMEAILARRFSPLNFSAISGFPNPVPHLSEWGDLLPVFREENDDDHAQHLINFHQCMEQLNLHQEDVLMKMFMFSLKDDARDWYFSLPAASISTLREFHVAFNFHCKRYYSSEFLFHDCCEEYEKSVQAALSFSPDCEVEEDPSLSFPSSHDLKEDFICCSYEEEIVDDFVLEANIFDNLASDEVIVSNIEQEQFVVDKQFDDEHFVDREHLETKHSEMSRVKGFLWTTHF